MKNIQIIQRAETGLGRLLCAGSGLEPLAGRHRGVGVPRERAVVGDLERIGPKRPARKRRTIPEGGSPGVTEKVLATMEERLVEMAGMIRAMKDGGSGVGPEAEPRRRRAVKLDLPVAKALEIDGGKISPHLDVPRFRPGYHRGMIVFTCPSCHYATAVYPRFGGKKTRCARCYAAIVAPRVRKGSRPIDMERHVEALLHPERFLGVATARGGVVGRLLKLVPREPSLMKCAGLAVLLLGLGAFGSLRSAGRAEAEAEAAPAPAGIAALESPVARGSAPAYKAEALEVVRRFHEAGDLAGKARTVRDCGGVVGKLAEHYARRPEDLERKVVAMKASGLGFQEREGGDFATTKVAVTYDDYTTCDFWVEHHAGESVIEWESSVGYNPRSWSESLAAASARRGESAQPFRVLAARDDYFNFGFQRAEAFLCVRLMAPVSGEVLGYAYAARGSADEREIEEALRESRRAVPLTLELEFTPESATTRQVAISRLVREGWRAGEGSSTPEGGAATLASVGKSVR